MYANKNNLRSLLTANVSTSATSISITAGEGILRDTDTVACLEHIENEVVTKREIIKITAKSTDTFTVTRGFATCIMNDSTKAQGNTKQSFSTGDYLSLYLSKELRESITTGISTNETALQTMIGHITAPETCINNCCLGWKQAIDSAYVTKCGGNAGFGDASDGDCIIDEDTFLCANKEYNFNNLTICTGVLVRFEGSGVPTINVRDTLTNCGTIDLRAGYVSNTCLTDCWKAKGCKICNKYSSWGACCGGCGGYRDGYCGCPGTATSGGYGGNAGDGCPGNAPDGENGGDGGHPTNCCQGYGGGGGGGGGGRFGNGGNGGNGGKCGIQSEGGKGGNGGNSGLWGTGGTGGAGGRTYGGNGGRGGDGGNGYVGGTGGTSCIAGHGGCGVVVGGTGGKAGCSQGSAGNGGNAITNVYGFHLNARNIYNHCVNLRGGTGGVGGDGYGSSCNTWFAYGGTGGNGANGGQMILTYHCIHDEGCFDVRGGEGGLGGWTYACKGSGIPKPSREASGCPGTDGWIICRNV